jgi:hypothetical protein
VITLAIIGALAVWLSHACVFVLAGVALTMVLPAMFRKEWANVGRQVLVYAIWAVSFASYFMCMHVMASRQSLVGFWSGDVPQPGAPAGGAFMPFPPTSLHDLGWFLRTFFGVFSDPGGFTLTGVAALAFLVGVTSMFSRRREVTAILLSPIALVLVASGLERFAFSGRVILFIVPCMLLLVGQGAEVIRESINSRGRMIGIVVLLLLFVHPTYAAARHVLRPRTHTELRPVLEYVEKHRRAGDMVYVNYGSRKPYRYYSRAYHFENEALVLSANAHQNWNWSGVLEDIQRLRGRGRVWVLFSGVWRFGGLDEEKFFLFHVDSTGTRIDAFERDGAAVYLYDMSGER